MFIECDSTQLLYNGSFEMNENENDVSSYVICWLKNILYCLYAQNTNNLTHKNLKYYDKSAESNHKMSLNFQTNIAHFSHIIRTNFIVWCDFCATFVHTGTCTLIRVAVFSGSP